MKLLKKMHTNEKRNENVYLFEPINRRVYSEVRKKPTENIDCISNITIQHTLFDIIILLRYKIYFRQKNSFATIFYDYIDRWTYKMLQWLNSFARSFMCQPIRTDCTQISDCMHAINTIVFPTIYLVADSLECCCVQEK